MNQTATEFLPYHLLNNSPDVVTMIDREGKIFFLSPSAHSIFNIDPKSLTISKVFELIHSSDRKKVFKTINENFKFKKRNFSIEYRYKSQKNEKWRWIESKGKIVAGEDKKINFIINSRDTTDVKSNLFELSLHKNALEQTGNGVVITAVSTKSKIVFANEEFCKMINLPMGEVLGKSFSEILSPVNSDGKLFREINTKIRRNKNFQKELFFNLPSRESSCYLIHAYPLLNSHGKTITHFVASFSNVTEKVTKENLLKEKNNELNSFVYKACHDLKGPLASIAGLSNIGVEQVKDNQAIELFKIIKESVSRLDIVLNELLFLSSIEHGKRDFKEIHIELIINDIIESYQFSKVFDSVKFAFNYKSKGIIVSDPAIVKSVIQNIIDNALKYKNYQLPLTEIGIETEDQKEGILISVKDNGVGIEQSQFNKIFDMFYRGNTNSKGTGLGLYIVKKSLEKLDGSISVESQIGIGSKFIIYLPNKNSKNE